MARTYEDIEKDILKIRKDLVEGIRDTLYAKGYNINNNIFGEYVNIAIYGDWDHIVICDKRLGSDVLYHVDNCSIDTILEAYRTALTVRPKF